MGLTHTPESKFIAVWICQELPCSILSVWYIMHVNRRSNWKVLTIWISREIPLFIFKRLGISWASNIHTSQKLWSFELAESFHFQFQASRYIMCVNQRYDWKVMIIWISREFPLFIFERLGISWASHIHPSQKLCPFEFGKSFPFEIRGSQYMIRLNHTHE